MQDVKLSTQMPENTGLSLICDNRSGIALEIVLPVYNEVRRIVPFIEYYKEFDVVLMDGGSNDGTIEAAIQKGATAYRRQGDPVGENHFTHYVNSETKSGRCFYMMADEFIDLEDLRQVSESLKAGKRVMGKRIDWFYGIQSNAYSCILPKGFVRGDAVYDPSNLHDTLRHADIAKPVFVVNVDHLHVFSMKDDYGKFGGYLYHEVFQLRKSGHSFRATGLRFLKLVRALQLNLGRFWKSPRIIFFLLAQFFATVFLFLMSFIEQGLLKDKDDQIRDYLKRYRDNLIPIRTPPDHE